MDVFSILRVSKLEEFTTTTSPKYGQIFPTFEKMRLNRPLFTKLRAVEVAISFTDF